MGINTLTSLQEKGISFAIPINLICDSAGIASGIAITPLSCPKFNTGEDQMRAALEKPKTGPNTRNLYQEEAAQLKASYERNEKQFDEQETQLKAKIAGFKGELSKDPNNLSFRERMQGQIDNVQYSLNQIPYSRAENKKTLSLATCLCARETESGFSFRTLSP